MKSTRLIEEHELKDKDDEEVIKKFLLISPKNRTVYNFRGDLVKAIKEKGYEVVVTGPDQTDVDRIEALGVRFTEIPMNKTGTSVKGDIGYCKALTKLMKEEKPDITLGYTIKPVIYGAIAAKHAHVPNINSLITGGGYTVSVKCGRVAWNRLYRILEHSTEALP